MIIHIVSYEVLHIIHVRELRCVAAGSTFMPKNSYWTQQSCKRVYITLYFNVKATHTHTLQQYTKYIVAIYHNSCLVARDL